MADLIKMAKQKCPGTKVGECTIFGFDLNPNVPTADRGIRN